MADDGEQKNNGDFDQGGDGGDGESDRSEWNLQNWLGEGKGGVLEDSRVLCVNGGAND